jgi:fructose-1,6-bisphosphatase/inositol monophosphatase family enzyme
VTDNTTAPDTADLLDVALEIAARAGELLLDRPPALGVATTKTSPTDVVTEMDTAAEKLIVSMLAERRPHDGILGEEGADTAGTSGVRWVVDPIDGTVNYLYDRPEWCVSVAAEDARGGLVGVVAIPRLGETFHAVRGGGAWLGGVRLRRRDDVALDRALVATGFGYPAARRAAQADVLRALLPGVRDIRRTGSAAIDLCSVACGRVDAYYERGLNPWDAAAGGLVAAEAGAVVTTTAPAADGSVRYTAAAPALHAELTRALDRLGA